MFHMLPVSRTRIAIPLIMLGLTTAEASAGQIVLDLRAVPVSDRRSLGVPGSAVGGTSGQPAATSKAYRLPLDVAVHSLTRQPGGKKITVELELINVGKSPVRVPSCVDQTKAHGPGALDRRIMMFGLAFQTEKKKISQLMDVTFGSSDARCAITLDPAQGLLVIDEVSVPEDVLATRAGAVAKAFVEERKLEDGTFSIQTSSERIESQTSEVPR